MTRSSCRLTLRAAAVAACALALAPPPDMIALGIVISVPLAIASYRIGDGPPRGMGPPVRV